MRTPVAFIIFNRPDVTERVFEAIAEAKPSQLFVIADGPRLSRPGEADACAATRAIIDRVDWPCEVLTNYSEANMGCGQRPHTGMQWLFEHVDRAIILEDDCLPHPSFFPFCEELLERYKDDDRVMHISGNCFHAGSEQVPFSYSFSSYSLNWGWATWRRAFKHYDRRMRLWPMFRNTSWLREILGEDPETLRFWRTTLETAYTEGENSSYWAYYWLFAMWAQRGVSILPNVNLVSNIGFGASGTHTMTINDPRANMPVVSAPFPLDHPGFIFKDREVDRLTFERLIRAQDRGTLYNRVREGLADSLPENIRNAIVALKQRMGPLARL